MVSIGKAGHFPKLFPALSGKERFKYGRGNKKADKNEKALSCPKSTSADDNHPELCRHTDRYRSVCPDFISEDIGRKICRGEPTFDNEGLSAIELAMDMKQIGQIRQVLQLWQESKKKKKIYF